jgi:hypothetical protein
MYLVVVSSKWVFFRDFICIIEGRGVHMLSCTVSAATEAGAEALY